jgi:hypothetical protein
MSTGKLRFAWRLAVGAAMDRATSVTLLDGGIAEVTAVDLAWRREVRRSQATILARLQALTGAESVTKVKVVTRTSKP